jgi:hypothetical protein
MAHVEPLKVLTLSMSPVQIGNRQADSRANLSSVTDRTLLLQPERPASLRPDLLCGYGDNLGIGSANGLLGSAHQTGRSYNLAAYVPAWFP